MRLFSIVSLFLKASFCISEDPKAFGNDTGPNRNGMADPPFLKIRKCCPLGEVLNVL